MCKKRMKRVLSICRAYFMRKHTRRKSVERAELSCRTCFGKMDGLLSPREWIDIARGAGVRAIAITDFQGVEGFKEAAQAVEKLRKEAGPGEVCFKMLYGLETVLEDGCPVHLLVRRQEGLAQLYRLLEIAWQGREKRPFLRKAEVSEHRTGLLVGCPGEEGEVYCGILDNLDYACLEEIAGFYDYLSVLPPQHYGLLSTREHAPGREAHSAEDLILKTIAIGKRSGRPVAAVGNVRTADQDWGMFRSSIAYGIQKDEEGDLDAPLPDLLYTGEMLDAFSFLGKELAEKIVIHAPNCLANRCSEVRIFPEDIRCLQPILPNAFPTVSELCREQLQTRYGGAIPETAREQIEYELAMLQNMEPNNRMGEITGNLKKDVKDLLSESANIVTGFFKRGLCTVRAVADKWKAFAQSVSSAADELMKPPFIEGQEAPTANLHPAAEPVVTVMESRDRNFPVGKQMTLSEANEYVRQMDASRHEAKATPHAVKVKIDYVRGDTSDRYWLPLEIGSGRGGLLEQMEQRLASYRADPERIMGELDFSKVDAKYRDDFQASFLPFIQKSMDDLNSNLLPFFRNHCSITELKRSAEALIPGMGEGRQAQYQAKLDERIAALRQMVNSGELKQAPQQVQIVRARPPGRLRRKLRQNPGNLSGYGWNGSRRGRPHRPSCPTGRVMPPPARSRNKRL